VSIAHEMLDTNPARTGFDHRALAGCIDACFACVEACVACADACLGEEMVAELRRCITTNLNCADICDATARVLSRQVGYDAALTRALLRVCSDACGRCAQECERHAGMYEHCRVCAEACRRCVEACDALLNA